MQLGARGIASLQLRRLRLRLRSDPQNLATFAVGTVYIVGESGQSRAR